MDKSVYSHGEKAYKIGNFLFAKNPYVLGRVYVYSVGEH